ncbi:MAG TPA: hypothetical protein VN922_07980 [Bacteroidia bacterium]|nr:hypothetical protein [Bacteroidia bacterium]
MLINCVGGIGDVLYCEPIYRHFFKKEGVKPIVIIHDHQMFLQDYIDSAEFRCASKYLDYKNNPMPNANYLPLRYANQVYRDLNIHDHSDFENCMPDKYLLAGLDPELWLTLDIKFNSNKGASLLTEYKILDNPKFIIKNEYSQAGKIDIKLMNDMNYDIIEMQSLPGYSVIDWFSMILCCQYYCTVSTSTFFILQAIKNKYPTFNQMCYIYARPNEDGLRGISKLKPTFNLVRVQ